MNYKKTESEKSKMKNNKKIKSLTIIAVVLLLAATVAVSTGIVVNRVDASTQSAQEQIPNEVLDQLNAVEEDDTDDTEETSSEIESVKTTPTAPATVAPTTTSTTTKIDGEADVLKTNTEVENNGVSDTTSTPVQYKEQEATTVSGTTPSAPTAPAVKKNETTETSSTTSTTSTTSDTVRFDNNLPVAMVENTDNQEVIVEEVTEIEPNEVSNKLAELFG